MKSIGYGLVFQAGAAIYCVAFFQKLGHTVGSDWEWLAFFVGPVIMFIAGALLIGDIRNVSK